MTHLNFRSLSALVLICQVVLLGVASPSIGASGALASRDLFCGQQVVARDFLQPLKRVAPIAGPPREGRLPFAPKGIRLEVERDGLVAGGGWIGFKLRDEAIEQRRHLGWVIESELSKVNSRGQVVSRGGIKRQRIGSIEVRDTLRLMHHVSSNPSFYRVSIRISRLGTARLLGEYSIYARVMKPHAKLRVVVDDRSVLPGDLVTARLINLGTVPFKGPTFAYGFVVQGFTGDSWTLVPENPPRQPPGEKAIKVPPRLPPGMEVRGCLRYRVPLDQSPGLFRFFSLGVNRPPLVAQFEVTGP